MRWPTGPIARAVVTSAALVLCLVAGSTPRVVGDGGEYLAQALNFSSGEGPALAEGDVPAITREVTRVAPVLAGRDLMADAVRDARGRYDFLHFWFYALLATPWVWGAQALGAGPIAGFLLLNLALFFLALAIALPRIGTASALLLFGSPIVWWLDKPHTEIFTFALLTIALVSLRDRPWWSFVALGAASAQNPPIAVLLAPALIAAIAHQGWRALRDRRLQGGLAAGLALALVHPLYSFDRHGVASLLTYAATDGMPAPSEMLAFVVDPVIGLVPNAPVFAAVVVAGAAWLAPRWRRDDGYGDVLLAAAALAVFLYAFGRTSNFHHGATPSISRYALWLLPLAVPVLQRLHDYGGTPWRQALWAAAVVSAAVNVVVFHPAVEENSREPTWLARWLWTQHPGWSNPLPEIFAETVAQQERPTMPVALAGCQKILTTGRDAAGVWPVPCYPAPLPAMCRARGVSCYANLSTEAGYTFVRAPGRREADGLIERHRVWPAEAEPHVRRVFDGIGWRSLEPEGPGADNLRAVHNVASWTLAAPDRLLVVLREPAEGAVLRFRTPGPVTGALIDGRTGVVVREVRHTTSSNEMWDVPIPLEHDTLLLVLRRTPGA